MASQPTDPDPGSQPNTTYLATTNGVRPSGYRMTLTDHAMETCTLRKRHPVFQGVAIPPAHRFEETPPAGTELGEDWYIALSRRRPAIHDVEGIISQGDCPTTVSADKAVRLTTKLFGAVTGNGRFNIPTGFKLLEQGQDVWLAVVGTPDIDEAVLTWVLTRPQYDHWRTQGVPDWVARLAEAAETAVANSR